MPMPNDERNTIERRRRIFRHSDDKGEAEESYHRLVVFNELQKIKCHPWAFYLTIDFSSLSSFESRSFSFCSASSCVRKPNS